MHLKSVHDPLEARKAWFFFDDEYVCLGSGIRAQSGLPIATTVEQCLQQGPVTVGVDGKSVRLKEGRDVIRDPEWIRHGNILYRFPVKANVQVQTGKATGSWRSINHQDWATDSVVQRDVVKIWFEEKEHRSDAYAYIVSPFGGEALEGTAMPATGVRILRNDTAVQAVEHGRLGILQSVFHEAGAFTLGMRRIGVDKPCLVMIGPSGGVHVSDPLRRSADITLTIDGIARKVRMPSGNASGTSAKAVMNE